MMLKLALVVLLVGWFMRTKEEPSRPCPSRRGANPLKEPECFFAPDYDSARAMFRDAAVKAGATLDELTLPCGYTIDIATLRGADDSKLLLHVSGTHGVEGYVGSAIQTGYLTWLAMRNKTDPSLRSRTAVFVHALNPYGMAKWRRVNENNVDLNRNGHLTQAELDEVLSRDPNVAGYETWSPVINPSYPPRPYYLDELSFLYNIGTTLMISGVNDFKRAIVTGTSTRPKGIIFVGREVQPSHLLFREYLSKKSLFQTVRDLIFVDVHSGLGPMGNDTMILSYNEEATERLFGQEGSRLLDSEIEWVPPVGFEEHTRKAEHGKSDTSAGYDLVKGVAHMTYPKLFTNLKSSIAVTQEFGTYSVPIVAHAFIMENQAHHYGTYDQKVRAAEYLKDVFTPKVQRFVTSTMKRGFAVISVAMAS